MIIDVQNQKNSTSEHLKENNKTLKKLLQIEQLDLEPIKYKLAREHHWNLETLDKTERHYKAFLQLHLLYPDTIHVPTVEIDEMWHMHILDTRKYMIDCYTLFGHYLHHYPYLGLQNEQEAKRARDLFANTRRKMVEHGLIDPDNPRDVAFADCGGGCSSCGSGGDTGGDTDNGNADLPAGPHLPSPIDPWAPSTGGDSPARKRQPEKPTPPAPRRGGGWWPFGRKERTPSPSFNTPNDWAKTVNPANLGGHARPGRPELEAYLKANETTILH